MRKTCFATRLRLNPANQEVCRDLGLVLWAKGARDEALGVLERAYAMDPAYPYAHASLAWARDQLGQHLASLEDCARSIEAAPDVAWNHHRMIELQHRVKSNDADRLVGPLWDRVAKALDPTTRDRFTPSARAAVIMAQLYGRSVRDNGSALELAEAAGDVPHLFLQVARASAFFESGRRAEAVTTLEAIVRMGQIPDFAQALVDKFRRRALPDLVSLDTVDSLLDSPRHRSE